MPTTYIFSFFAAKSQIQCICDLGNFLVFVSFLYCFVSFLFTFLLLLLNILQLIGSFPVVFDELCVDRQIVFPHRDFASFRSSFLISLAEFVKSVIKDAKKGVFLEQPIVEETFFILSSDEDSDAEPEGHSDLADDDEDFVKKPPFRPLRKVTQQSPVPVSRSGTRVTGTRTGGGTLISHDKVLSPATEPRGRSGSSAKRPTDGPSSSATSGIGESGSRRGGRAASLAVSEKRLAPKARRLTEIPADSTPMFTQLLKDFFGPNSSPEEQSFYSRKTTQIYQSERFLGTLSIPVIQLTSASDAPEYCTRPLVESHVVSLMNKFVTHTAGFLVRDTFKVVFTALPGSEFDLNDLIDKYNEFTGDPQEFVLWGLKMKAARAITIGGNHSREACCRLIRGDKISSDLPVRCDVFFGLDPSEAKAIGFVDNIVSSDNLCYSLLDKVTMVRDIWLDPAMVDKNGKFTPEAGEIIVRDILYKHETDKPVKKKKKEVDLKAQIRSANPMISSCKIPETAWPIVRTALSKSRLVQSDFRNMSWRNNEKVLTDAFSGLISTGDLTSFKANLKLIRNRVKLVPSIENAWAVTPGARQVAESAEEFVEFIDGRLNINVMTQTFEKELTGLNYNVKFTSQELNSMLLRCVKDYACEQQDSQTLSRVILCKNRSGKSSTHQFKIASCERALAVVTKRSLSVGLVIMDPPFGVLTEDWDEKWPDFFWSGLFTTCFQQAPTAPIVVFVSDEQVSQVITTAVNCGFQKSRMYTWLKTGYWVNQPGKISRPANIILVFWKQGSMPFNQHDKSFLTNGNFVATPKITKFRIDGTALNATEKPVILIRTFINSFCVVGKVVLDMTCGSGSVAMAAASLGYDSLSFDIRESQVEGAMTRLLAENSRPTWYPDCSVVHCYKVLENFLKEAVAEPVVIEKSPSSKKKTKPSVDLSSESSGDSESDRIVKTPPKRVRSNKSSGKSDKSKDNSPSQDKLTVIPTRLEPPFVNHFDLREVSDNDDADLSEFLRVSPKSLPERHLRGLDSVERAELADSVSVGSEEPVSSDEEVTAVDADFIVGASLSSESDGDYEPASETVVVQVSPEQESTEVQESDGTQEDSMVLDEEVPEIPVPVLPVQEQSPTAGKKGGSGLVSKGKRKRNALLPFSPAPHAKRPKKKFVD